MRKLGVVAIVVVGLLNISRSVEIAFSSRDYALSQFFVTSLLMSFILLGFGILLIAFRHQLAKRWFHDTALDVSIDAPAVVRLGLILLGVLILTRALPGMFAGATVLLGTMSPYYDRTFLDDEAVIRSIIVPLILGPFFQIGLGSLFILRSGPIAERLWSTGKGKEEDAPFFPQCPLCGTPFDPSDYRSDAGTPKCTSCGEPLDLGVEDWNARGVGLDREGKHEEAIKYFEKAIEIDPADADLWNNKGMSLDDLQRFDEAIAAYDRALELSPQDADIWYNKGYSLVQDEKLQEAMACFSKALELDPEHADALSATASLKERFRRQG